MPTHKRIRMFNTRDTYPNQALDNDLCQAVVAGNTWRAIQAVNANAFIKHIQTSTQFVRALNR